MRATLYSYYVVYMCDVVNIYTLETYTRFIFTLYTYATLYTYTHVVYIVAYMCDVVRKP